MNWILCGFKRCGKTYFGSRLNLPFIDTDDLIENEIGCSLQKFVQLHGMEAFRKREREVIQSIDVKNHVIASGGGSVLCPHNVAHFQRLGALIYLKCPKEVLRERIFTPPLPTFIQSTEDFEQIYSTRIKEYEKISAYQVDLLGKTDSEIIQELKKITQYS